MNLGITIYRMGEYQESVKLLNHALEIFSTIEDKYNRIVTLGDLANCYAALGDSDQAFARYEEALAGARETSDIRTEANVLFNMGLELARVGRHDEAIAISQRALEIFERIQDQNGEKVSRQIAEWKASPAKTN